MRVFLRQSAVAAVVAGWIGCASTAHAEGREGQDSASFLTFAPTGTLRLGVETEAAGFRLDGQRGSFLSGIPRIEYAPSELVSTRLRVPFHSVALDDEIGTRNGIGDLELRLRLNLRRAEPLHVAVGWDVQMPTASKHEGLGEGAVQITPFATFGVRIKRVVVYLTLADNMSLAGSHEVRLTNYIDPSEDNELRGTAGTIVSLVENVSASAFLTETTILTTAERWDKLLTGGLQLAVQPDPKLRLILSDQLPLAGEHRFSWS